MSELGPNLESLDSLDWRERGLLPDGAHERLWMRKFQSASRDMTAGDAAKAANATLKKLRLFLGREFLGWDK
jgi:hypothetical protein